MSIAVQCDCGKKYQVGDDKAGKKFRCKACNEVVAIPKPAAEPADEWDEFDDFGDEWNDEPAPQPAKRSTSKGKSGKGRKSGGSKSKKRASGGEMSPAVKYSIAGGIVVVTAGIVVAILMSRGVIGGGGGDKDNDDKNRVANNDSNNDANNDDASKPIPGKSTKQNPRELELLASTRVVCRTSLPGGFTYRISIWRAGASPSNVDGKVVGIGDSNGSSKGPKIQPDSGDVRDEARRAVAKNNLRMVALAMHNYHDVFSSFPAPLREGKQLSWRVYLLPFLSQHQLFKQFKLDEPWDSPHNKTLIAKMPQVFNSPGTKNDGKTTLHRFVGSTTPAGNAGHEFQCEVNYKQVSASIEPNARYTIRFRLRNPNGQPVAVSRSATERTVTGKELAGKTSLRWKIQLSGGRAGGKLRLRDITDGSSNTLLAVWAGPETAVEWTKPGGLPFNPKNPAAVLGTVSATGIPVVTYDGRMAMLSPKIDARSLGALIQHRDSTVVSLAKHVVKGSTAKPKIKPGWTRYVAKDRSFEAEFPSTVLERKSRTPKGSLMNVFLGGSQRSGCMVVYLTSPAFKLMRGEVLYKALEKGAAAMKAKSTKRIKMLGKPAVEAMIVDTRGSRTLLRQVVVGDRLYQLMAIGPNAGWKDDMAKRFFASFHAPARSGGPGKKNSGSGSSISRDDAPGGRKR